MAKKVLFINQEIFPYVPETTMAKMGHDLPVEMQEDGYEIRMFMPKWGIINERRGQLHEVIRLSGMNLVIDDTDHPLIIKVASIPQTRLQVYFIDNDDLFVKRLMAVDENGQEYADNGERAIFFARGVLETVKKLKWVPDIIHCQGWVSAVAPLYVKKVFGTEPTFVNTKVVTSLFNTELTNNFGKQFKRSLELGSLKSKELKPYKADFDYKELMRLAIDYSDAVVEAEAIDNDELHAYLQESGKRVVKAAEGTNVKTIEALYEELTK